MTTLHLRKSINRFPLRRGFPVVLLALALALFAPSRTAQAQLPSPSPDGGYLNGNTAEGDGALQSLTTGGDNTANGFKALSSNTTGGDNTANGVSALLKNTTGGDNTGIGVEALFSNTTGGDNTATGVDALAYNTTGFENTANGVAALLKNTTGSFNTANGVDALVNNTIGFNNTAIGSNALFSNTTGNLNIALGLNAGQNLTTGSNNIDIGNAGVAAESNIIRIGNEVAFTDLGGVVHPVHAKTFIAGISRVAVTGAVVRVTSSGQLGVAPSSERFKDAIKPMDKASEAILALKPVTFRYKKEIDPKSIPQFGLVAEQVEKVNPDLVARDEQGKVYTVRYEAVNAMLLNEFLKEHRKVGELEKDLRATIAQQQEEIQALIATVKEQAAQMRKVRAQLASAPRMVVNN